MTGEDEKPERSDVTRVRPDYTEALRTYHKPLPNDEKFKELLRRLDEAEQRKKK